MLLFVELVLLALWTGGMATSNTLGGGIHLLLGAALLLALVRAMKERAHPPSIEG